MDKFIVHANSTLRGRKRHNATSLILFFPKSPPLDVGIAAIGIVCLKTNADMTYFRFGPHETLIILSVSINTWSRWFMLVGFLSVMGLADVLTEELANPVLNFTIYNPDKTRIEEFDKNELQALANLTYFTSSVKRLVLMLVQISQFDLAIIHIMVTEVATIFTIRSLLNEKQFGRYSAMDGWSRGGLSPSPGH